MYTLKDFQREFPDDDTCLNWLRQYRWPECIECEGCGKHAKYYRITTRKVFGCEWCGYQISPTAGTIYHKSKTPLTIWFYVIFLLAQTRGGISAKQIQRETGVTYKTAWRMCNQIRDRLDEDFDPFDGETEIDESYFGGKHKGKRGRGADGKTAVVGIANRGGKVEVRAVPDTNASTILPMVWQNVKQGLFSPTSIEFMTRFPRWDTSMTAFHTQRKFTYVAMSIPTLSKAFGLLARMASVAFIMLFHRSTCKTI